MNHESAFKSYDIRGIRQKEIDEEFGRRMGYALGKYLLEKHDSPRVLIVGDVRLANNILIDNFLSGCATAGVKEVEIFGRDEKYPQYTYGICSTSMAYHAGLGVADCTIIFSASHNTAEYVGIKIVDKEAKYIPSKKLKELFLGVEAPAMSSLPQIKTHETKKISELFADLTARFELLTQAGPLPKITVDYSNGAGVHFEQDFLRSEHIKADHFEHINELPDSNFSNHESDTSRFANYDQLIKTIKENGSEFGFMFDGDVDRIGLCLPNGRVVTGDVLLAIIAKQLLESGDAQKVGSKEVFQEVLCSRTVRDVVEKYGGNLHIVRVGRGAFIDEVIEKNGLIAGETSAHILFKEYGTIEVPLLALYYLIKEMQLHPSAEAMIETYMPYVRGQILHFACDDKDAVIQAVKEKYSEYPQLTIDGVRVEGKDRWFTVRKSGTEPIIKVGLEGETQEIYNDLLAKIRTMMKALGAHEE